jgi:hypothetical protein
VRRPVLLLLIAVGVLVFLAISAILARVLSIDGAERAAITSLITAQARGDAGAMSERMYRCPDRPGCRSRVAEDARNLRHPGSVSIIQIQSSAGFSLGGTLGAARVAWQAGGSLPIVQCVRVRRAGNALSGLRVELLQLSRRIPSESACPARF